MPDLLVRAMQDSPGPDLGPEFEARNAEGKDRYDDLTLSSLQSHGERTCRKDGGEVVPRTRWCEV